MVYARDVWKIFVLAWWLILMPPVLGYMGTAKGQNTHGGVPLGTPAGTYIDLGGGVKGTYAFKIVLFEDNEEYLIATRSAYTSWPSTGVLAWWLPSKALVTLSPGDILDAQMRLGLPGQYYNQQWFRDAVLNPQPGSAASSLPYDKDGGIANESIVAKYVRMGWGWDTNGDGDVDMDDYKDIFDGDMDNDGIADATDLDTDGDGELNTVEILANGFNNDESRTQFDFDFGLDRDMDQQDDLKDLDGDGVPNWVEHKLGTNINSAASRPSGNVWFTGQPDQPPSQWADTDHDGAWDWLEVVAGVDPNSPSVIPDWNSDGIWDWGKPNVANFLIAFGPEPVPIPPTVPTNPQPDTPGSPTQVVSFATPPSSGMGANGAAAGMPINPSTSNTNNSNTYITNGQGSSTPGNAWTYGPSGGSEGGTGEGGDGDYHVVFDRDGVADNWKGVGGGSWEQRTGIDYTGATTGTWSAIASKADLLRGQLGQAPNAGADALHKIAFPIRWVDGTTKRYDVSLLPDSSTEAGAAANMARTFLYMCASIIAFYIFMSNIWTALRQF